MAAEDYAQGGYIQGTPVVVNVHPDECFIRAEDVRSYQLVCSRAGHPTVTSDCDADRVVAQRAS